MKWFIGLLVWLYPASWRQRYRTEFDALLEEIKPGWHDFFDVFKEALEMHLTIGMLGKHVAVFGVAGALLAAALSFTLRDKYRSEARVTLQNEQGQAAALEGYRAELERLARKALGRDSLMTIIEKQHLYESQRANKSMDEVVEKMRSDIRVVLRSPTSFEVSFDYADGAQAQQTTIDLVGRLIEGHLQFADTSPMRFRLNAAPSRPQTALGPNRAAITAFGLGTGLFVGATVAWFRRLRAQDIV